MKTTLLLSALLLSGCAADMQRILDEESQLRDDVARSVPVCEGDADCMAKWEAAQLWVQKHSDLKIQTVTTVVIETYNPPSGSTDFGMSVTKEPLGGGRYKIVAAARCGLAFGCTATAGKMLLEFNSEVAAATP